MSKKITKKFTFTAPDADYVVDGATERKITSTYKGLSCIWVYVDVNTGKSPQFVSDGDLPDPTTTWRHRSVLLNADNPNHILLMDLLSSSKGHTNNKEYTIELNSAGDIKDAPEFIFRHSDLEEPPANRYYDLDKTHIDEKGVVTYEYLDNKDEEFHLDNIEFMIEQEILKTEEKKKDPVVIETPKAIERCNRHIAVLQYAKDVLLKTVKPWKIAIPGIHEV